MTCDQAELRMAELLAGEIAPAERSALERHLLDCSACRGDFELARAGTRAEWADVPVPKEVIEATLASFRELPAAARLLRWATAAAAVFGLAVLLVTSTRPPKPLPAPSAQAPAPRREVLATMQEPGVGALVCKDEDGRPVGELGLRSHDVTVEILDGIAKTTVEENFENHTDRRLEGTFQFPLPSDASISRLALEVNGKIEEGTCLERERAREVFESIVRRMQDPALLEWQPGGFFKCRVFPIEPRATKRVIVAYTQALPCFQGKMTYVYPLASEKTRTHPPEEVRISVLARFSGALAKIESPSHRLDVQRKSANEASMAFHATRYRPNNDLVVTMEPADEEVRVVSHKPEGDEGYFACFLTPRGGAPRSPARYAFVLDVSASISAPRLEVAKRLVRAMMERRIPGDRFEILAHHIEVERSGEVDLRAANDFMDRLRPIGGSDVLRALQAARDAEEILYIGKGAPTFGETDPAKILEAVKGRKIRTIAVGSDANGLLLEKLGGMMRVNPNDDVPLRVAEIAATLGSPALSEVKVEGEGISEVVGARDLFFGERLVVSGRYREGATKLVVTGRGYRREVEVAFPAKEERNNYVRRLWAQRKVADLLASGDAAKPEVTALGVKYQIMTPYTSFLVLESEQMWKDHQLKREVQKQDQVLGKQMEEEKKRMAEAESAAYEIQTKRDVTRKMAQLLKETYQAIEQKGYERAMTLCDQILLIDPHYEVAKDLKDRAGKTRHKEEYYDTLSLKVEELKKATDDAEQAVIPSSQTVRFPSREEWREISSRLEPPAQVQASTPEMEKIAQELARGRSAQEQQAISESQRRYEQALLFNNRGDLDRAKREAQKAVEAWHENTPARKLLNDINRLTVGGRPELGARSLSADARNDFHVKTEQAQIEITKHVRDGERYLNARMYDQAAKEFENAEFKILSIPYEVKAMNELLPLVKDSMVKVRNARLLEPRRIEEEKKRMAEAEASAHETKPADDREWAELLGKLKANDAVTEREKMSRADDLYRGAEKSYQSGDFEKAVAQTKQALELAPAHAPARALNTEVQFILSQGRATPTTQEYDKFMHEALVRHQQVLIEVDSAFEKGRRDYSRGDYAQGEREFRKILEYSKWMPTGVELDARRKAAAEMLDRTRAVEGVPGPGFSSMETARPTFSATQSPQTWRDEYVSVTGLQRFPIVNGDGWSPVNDFWTANVADLYKLTKEAIPSMADFPSVDIPLATAAPTLDTENSGDAARINEVRRLLEEAKTHEGQHKAETQALAVELPLEGLQKPPGKPKGLSEMREGLADEDKAISGKLRSTRVTMTLQNAPLTAIVDHLQELSGLNIHITGVDNPDCERLSVQSRDEVLEDTLRRLLEPRNLAYRVKDGVLLITRRDALLRIRSVNDSGDRVSLAGNGLTEGMILAVSRESKFVALLRVELDGSARVLRGYSVGRILPGDEIDRVADPVGYLAALPADVRADLASRLNQDVIRAKMGLKE